MSKSVDKPRLRNTLKKLRRVPFDRGDPYNQATAPQEMLDFLAMISGLKPVVLIGRGFDDTQWVRGVKRIAEEMSLHVIQGPKWHAEPEFIGLPEWYASTDQKNLSEDPVVYICKSQSISKLVTEICDAESITIEEESFLLGYPHCCVQDHYFKHRMMNQGFILMLNRVANGDKSEMIRLVKEDVGMSPETDEEVKCTTEARRFALAPYTNIIMCRTCEENRDSPARLISKQFKQLAENIDSKLASEIDIGGRAYPAFNS